MQSQGSALRNGKVHPCHETYRATIACPTRREPAGRRAYGLHPQWFFVDVGSTRLGRSIKNSSLATDQTRPQ